MYNQYTTVILESTHTSTRGVCVGTECHPRHRWSGATQGEGQSVTITHLTRGGVVNGAARREKQFVGRLVRLALRHVNEMK